MWNFIDEYWDSLFVSSLIIVHFLAIFSAA
jgi:hypothetical protein